ncbi:HD domain-containing protein [Patescibacteria group bacterium]
MNKYTDEIKEFVRSEMQCSAHSLDHVMRVYSLCLNLVEGEVDLEVLEASALLHDIASDREQCDKTGKTDHAIEGAKIAETFLRSIDFPKEKINHVKNCITSHRYKTNNEPKTIEAKILFDADKLEAIGAIGIARSYAWIGSNDACIYKEVDDIGEYARENLSGRIGGRIQDKSKHSVQIEHEVKTKFLLKKLYTKKAKEIGEERMIFFENFLKRLEKEVCGEV